VHSCGCRLPQWKNASLDFNKEIYDTLIELSVENLNEYVFLSADVDGLATESKFVMDMLEKFLIGDVPAPVMTDANHNMKSMQYQIIGGSECVTCGTIVIDPGLLQQRFPML